MKVGDKVTIIKIDDEYYGRVGIITKSHPYGSEIKFTDGTIHYFSAESIISLPWGEIRKQRRQFEERLRSRLSNLERNDAIEEASKLFNELSKII